MAASTMSILKKNVTMLSVYRDMPTGRDAHCRILHAVLAVIAAGAELPNLVWTNAHYGSIQSVLI